MSHLEDWEDWEKMLATYPCWKIVHMTCSDKDLSARDHDYYKTDKILTCNVLDIDDESLKNSIPYNCRILWTLNCDIRDNPDTRALGLTKKGCGKKREWK